MYICLCKAVTDHQLQSAIESGLCSRKQLIECFGVGRDCGKCNRDIAEMLVCRKNSHLMLAQNDVNYEYLNHPESEHARRYKNTGILE